MENLDAAQRFRLLESRNAFSDLRSCRVTFGGQHHANRGVWTPARLNGAELTLLQRHQEFYQVRPKAHQDRLRFGVAQADVVLEHLRPFARQDQSEVQEAAIGNAVGSDAGQRGSHNPGQDILGLALAEQGVEAESAHAPRVRALVIVEQLFMVLHRDERKDSATVGQDYERYFLPQ